MTPIIVGSVAGVAATIVGIIVLLLVLLRRARAKKAPHNFAEILAQLQLQRQSTQTSVITILTPTDGADSCSIATNLCPTELPRRAVTIIEILG